MSLAATLTHLVLREVAANTTSATTSSANATCTTAVPGKYGNVPADACNSNYLYNPSFVAAILFSILFGTVTVAHITQARIYRKTFCWVLIMGCIWETASFIVRSLSTRFQQNSLYVTISTLLFLLAPLWINAFDYMVLGRLIHFLLPSQSMYKIKAIKLAKLFVWLDILSFVVQLAGGLMITGSNVPAKQLKTGQDIYMGGIGLQQAFILIFAAFAIGLYRRCLVEESNGSYIGTGKEHWRRYLIALYISLILISTRIIYRLCEFSGGFTSSNTVIYHEVYIYVLDATPMFLATLVMSLLHPGQFLKGLESEFPKVSRKEKKEIKRTQKEAKKAAKFAKKNGGQSIDMTKPQSYNQISYHSDDEMV